MENWRCEDGEVDNDPGVVSQAKNEHVQCSGDEFSDEEADLESSHEDGDYDLERSPQAEADFVDVECRGEKDDVQSEYYDSEDPLSYQSEKEEVEASFEQITNATSRFKRPSYNPNVESVDLEVGTYMMMGNSLKRQ
nr:uncharacterized protein LOC109164765 [Ipomoea batatas]